MIEVLPMQDDVEHHWIALLFYQFGNPGLKLEGTGVAQEIIKFAGRVLQAELNMIESRAAQFCNSPLGESDARSYEVGIIAECMSLADQDFEIIAHQRFAARKSELHKAQFTTFA